MESTGGDSSGFPLDVWTHGYLDFTAVTWKVMWRRVDLEGAREIITRRGRAFLALAASLRDGQRGHIFRESLLVTARS